MRNYLLIFAIILSCLGPLVGQNGRNGIHIDPSLPNYWHYDGKAVLLIGGSSEDNLFQIPNIEEELDLIHASGGNYIRCTMSSRDSGNVWPFKKEGEKYNLDQFNDVYWERFRKLLQESKERDIIVQIELWATFDFYREPWLSNPFNPRNDKFPQKERIRLPEEVPSHPVFRENPFFWSVPLANNNTALLAKQQKYIDKLLSISLQFDHLLYCIDNETSVTAQWPMFWANYIKAKAKLQGKRIYVTEMWDPHDLFHPDHLFTIQHPDLFDFIDISQNNHQKGKKHYENGRKFSDMVNALRGACPLNTVKTYGNQRHGSVEDGQERFWRSAFLGVASVRFHRPNSGLGISELAQQHIKSMRMLFDQLDIYHLTNAQEIFVGDKTEAYAIKDNKFLAIYFPKGGDCSLTLGQKQGIREIKWLDILNSQWLEVENKNYRHQLDLTSPGDKHWVALISLNP